MICANRTTSPNDLRSHFYPCLGIGTILHGRKIEAYSAELRIGLMIGANMRKGIRIGAIGDRPIYILCNSLRFLKGEADIIGHITIIEYGFGVQLYRFLQRIPAVLSNGCKQVHS